MRKKYKAMGAMSLALTTAFISLQGVDVISSMASPLESTSYPFTEVGIHTDSNVNNGRDRDTVGGSDTTGDAYGEWLVIKEPTVSEDGLKKREYISSDGTRYEEYMSIPRLEPPYPMPFPIEPHDPKILEPTIPETTVPDRKDDSATKSNTKKRSRHSSSGKPKKLNELNDVKETGKSFDSTNNNKTETTTETTKSVDTKNKQTEKTVENKTNVKTEKKDSSIESTESKNDMSSITSGIDNNMENAIESSEITAEIKTDKNDSTKGQDDKISNEVEQKSDGEITLDTVLSKDKSFNRYDGVTLLAAGAYTWWIAIVLLPMINALKWINKKRREKARDNVNKKYN